MKLRLLWWEELRGGCLDDQKIRAGKKKRTRKRLEVVYYPLLPVRYLCLFLFAFIPLVLLLYSLVSSRTCLLQIVVVNMGFLKACVDTLLSLATFNFVDPYDVSTQRPLFSSSDAEQAPISTSPIPDTISFQPNSASPGFECVYPKRWKPCNTETSRDCWLQDTKASADFGAYSQIDIHTDCQWINGRADIMCRGAMLTMDSKTKTLRPRGFNER